MTDLLQEFVPLIVELIFVFAIPFLLTQVARFVGTRRAVATDGRVRDALAVVEKIVSVHLTAINAEIVEKLKEANADGELTPEEIAAVKRYALNRIWETVPANVKDILLEFLPGGEDGILSRFISPLVEFALRALKAGGLIPTSEEIAATPHTTSAHEAAKARARIGLR